MTEQPQDSRKAIHAYLTNEAHDTWHKVAAENGVSVSGLIEAMGQDWLAHMPGETDEYFGNLVKHARKIDTANRRRAGRRRR